MTQLSDSSYDEVKAAQVAFYFLSKAQKHGKHITKLKFIKWMYLSERMSYQKFGDPLFGDTLASIKHGPVPSKTLCLIEKPSKLANAGEAWKNVVHVDSANKHQYLTITDSCPYNSIDDLTSLSDAEVDLLDHVWEKYGRMSAKALETYLHNPNFCPEWKWIDGDRTNSIELETLFQSLGYNLEQTSTLIERLQTHENTNQVFAH